ncbi:MAG: hypothetical protein IPJ22_13395 [Bacteroidetes bacterium]|nr:hypothetical protein [Bacteroidota bacterium]
MWFVFSLALLPIKVIQSCKILVADLSSVNSLLPNRTHCLRDSNENLLPSLSNLSSEPNLIGLINKCVWARSLSNALSTARLVSDVTSSLYGSFLTGNIGTDVLPNQLCSAVDLLGIDSDLVLEKSFANKHFAIDCFVYH